MKTPKHQNTKTPKRRFLKGFVFRFLIFSLANFGLWGCELETFEEIPTAEISEQVQGPFQVQSAT